MHLLLPLFPAPGSPCCKEAPLPMLAEILLHVMTICYRLNICVFLIFIGRKPNPNVMVFEGRAFGR